MVAIVSMSKNLPHKSREPRSDMIAERRSSPRVKKVLPVKIHVPVQDKDIVIHSRDISCNGAFCCTEQFIAPMTRLDITMLIPRQLHQEALKVTCKGVVVRIKEDPKSKMFTIGIFFTDMKEKERRKLEDFVANHLLSPTHNA
jgi:c-di-GMP-binding flagellar brake protein YcgR